jgi:hypothetical protein
MKTLLLASAIVAVTSIGSAFGSVIVYADGSTYDPTVAAAQAKAMCPVPATYQADTGTCASSMQVAPGLNNTGKVVRWGPPDAGAIGGNG